MSSEITQLTPKLYNYFQKVSYREPPILKKLRNDTQKLSTAVMQISPEQGQFMALLVELIGAKKTIDIGTYTGYSALAVALALPKDGKVVSCDVDVDCTNKAKIFWQEAGVADKIELNIGKATDTLQRLINEGEANTFDFAFIDADKTNYEVYFEQALALLRPGGLIAVDNVLWNGQVADQMNNDSSTCAIRALNEKILNDDRVTMCMIPIGDGLTLAKKR